MVFKWGEQILMPLCGTQRSARRPQTLNISSVGEVKFIRRKGARNIKISVQPFRGVKVSVPYGVAFKTAEKFVDEKHSWILKQLAWVKKVEEEHEDRLKKAEPFNAKYARLTLIARLDELSERYGLPYNKVFIRQQKTRWGSCSEKNNINLNIQLMRLPEELRDYVIIHELMHTKFKNHGKAFWQALDVVLIEAKTFDKRLRKYHTWLL